MPLSDEYSQQKMKLFISEHFSGVKRRRIYPVSGGCYRLSCPLVKRPCTHRAAKYFEDMSMGIVNGRLILKNPRKPNMAAVETSALADSGAVYLSIPEHICL